MDLWYSDGVPEGSFEKDDFEICQQSTHSFNVLFRWEEAGEAYLSESWKRQVMWYVKDDSKLGMLDTDQKYRLEHTLQRTAVSRKLLAFQVNIILIIIITTVLPAKSDSDFMFCLQSYQGLIIDISLVY